MIPGISTTVRENSVSSAEIIDRLVAVILEHAPNRLQPLLKVSTGARATRAPVGWVKELCARGKGAKDPRSLQTNATRRETRGRPTTQKEEPRAKATANSATTKQT